MPDNIAKIAGAQRCETCRYFFKPLHLNSCRRFPPQVTARVGQEPCLWPYVNTADWCGEWRATQRAEDAAMQAAIREAFDD